MARLLVVIASLAAVAAALGAQSQVIRFRHPGVIVDARDGKPLPDADAKAFGARRADARGSCKDHNDPLDSRRTSTNGSFTFEIDGSKGTYYAVYCSNLFQSLEVPANENFGTGPDVRPTPIRLFPLIAPNGSVDGKGAVVQAVTQLLEATTAILRSVRAKNLLTFPAIAREAGGDQELVTYLVSRDGRPMPERLIVPQGTAREAVLIALNDGTIHIRYFAASASDVFDNAVSGFAGPDRQAIQRLRMRPLVSVIPPAAR